MYQTEAEEAEIQHSDGADGQSKADDVRALEGREDQGRGVQRIERLRQHWAETLGFLPVQGNMLL